MPKPHTRILESLPSDRLQIGDCMVDVTTRDISNHADIPPRRVSLKAIDVLLVLVAHPGKVVSRETLLETVWPDTLPADDVVTQAVAQLRKAFGVEHPYIETIAKHGYRLLAPVMWLDMADPAAGPPARAFTAAPGPAPARYRTALLGAAAAIGLVLLGAGAWRAWGPASDAKPIAAAPSTAGTPAPLDYQRITSAPGSESWPDLSPDGSLVVYSAYSSKLMRTALMVQTTAPVEPRPLTEPAEGSQDMLASWSPDGRQIAFFRRGSDDCQLMTIAATGGAPRPIGPCSDNGIGRIDWHPNGKQLIVAGGTSASEDGRALAIIDLASGRRQRLAYARGHDDIDVAPAYSPDGRWLAFQRNISRGDIWIMPTAGGTPRPLTHLQSNIYGLAWTPDSRGLVFSGYFQMRQQLLRVELDSGRVHPLGIEAMDPTIAAGKPSLAFVLATDDSALFRTPVVAHGAGTEPAQPERVFASSGGELLPSVAPDGRQIVFVSDRTGQGQLWWSELPKSGPEGTTEPMARAIEGFAPFPRHPAVWSADARRVLVIGRVGETDGLYEITPADGRVQRLPVPNGAPTFAVYLPDPQRLLVVADSGAGRLGLTLYDRHTNPWRALATINDVSFVRVDPTRQRVVFFRNGSWGLWQADLELRRPTLLDDLQVGTGKTRHLIIPGAGFYVQSRRLAMAPDGVHIVGSDDSCPLRWITLAAPDAARAMAPCLDSRGGMVTGVSFDATHGDLYFSHSDGEQSDIGWARLPDGPAGLVKPAASGR